MNLFGMEVDKATVSQEQRSSAWHEQRKKRLGGSEIASAIGISPYKSRRQLWLEKTDQVVQVDISNLPHVKRGIDAEPRARQLVEEVYGRKFPDKVFTHSLYPHFAASLDGYAADAPAQSLEIKTMGLEKHLAVKNGEIPEYYKCQLQWNMLISGTESMVFASFRPEWDEPGHPNEADKLLHLVVEADPKEQARLFVLAEEFWKLVVTREDPGLEDADFQWVLEKDWLAAAARYREIKSLLGPLEKELETHEKLLKSRGPVKCGGLTIAERKVKGTIDMKRLAVEAPDVMKHVEAYRKPDSKTLAITVEKGLK